MSKIFGILYITHQRNFSINQAKTMSNRTKYNFEHGITLAKFRKSTDLTDRIHYFVHYPKHTQRIANEYN